MVFEDSVLQPVALKIDPGSRVTGMTLACIESTPEGEVHHALFLSEVRHRGEAVHDAKRRQANARRRRRSANLRHRASRFLNQRRPGGWLPPSLLSRVGNVLTWTARYCRWAPVTRLEVERVRFDMQLIQNPEITGTEYQHGELAGWELRSYLLLKYDYRCAYCGKQNTPFELDHRIPRSRGGSSRTSNLVLACHECNQVKANQTAAEFGHPDVAARAKVPLKDAAAVNATRFQLVEVLRCFGLPIGTWSGGRTSWNRARFGLGKTHALDALAVGQMARVTVGKLKTLQIIATGRGQHCRTNFTKEGFPYSSWQPARRTRCLPSWVPLWWSAAKGMYTQGLTAMFVPVIDSNQQPLMPTTPARARRWIESGKATPFWKREVFCVRLNVEPSARNLQPVAVGIDPGSKKEGYSVVSAAHTYLNVQADTPHWVKDAVAQRRRMRRARRNRKTPCRQPCAHRLRATRKLPPSTKARWQWKLRVARWLGSLFPVAVSIVEDIKAATRGKRQWDQRFSPLEVGKHWFYTQLAQLAPVHTKQGWQMKELREALGLKKSGKKMAEAWNAHCIDAWVLARSHVGGQIKPDNMRLVCITPLQWHRRQLHRY